MKKILLVIVLVPLLSSCTFQKTEYGFSDAFENNRFNIESITEEVNKLQEETERLEDITVETSESEHDSVEITAEETGMQETDTATVDQSQVIKTNFRSEAPVQELINQYIFAQICDQSNYGCEGYRVSAGMYVIQSLYDFESEKMSVYTNMSGFSEDKNRVDMKSMPEIYYWIKYKGLTEEEFKKAEGKALQAILSLPDSYRCICDILSDDDIYVLYHGNDEEIKRQFMLPFSYLDKNGRIISASSMMRMIKENRYNDVDNTPLPDEIIEEYRVKCLKDIVAYGYYNAVTEYYNQSRIDSDLKDFCDFIFKK